MVNGAGRPEIAHSCLTGDFGDPAVRIKDFIDAFGTNGLFSSICESTYGPVLERIAKEIGKRIGAQCIDGIRKDTDASQPDLQPDCSVVDETRTDGSTVYRPLPNCALDAAPCWRLERNDRDCALSHFEITIDRGDGAAPDDTVTSVRCATCVDASAPGCQP